MQNRLFARLGAWAMAPDDALLADLAELGVERTPDADELAQAPHASSRGRSRRRAG